MRSSVKSSDIPWWKHPNLLSPSSKDTKSFVSNLREKRIVSKGPDTLHHLSAMSIVQNRAMFLDEVFSTDNNIFADIPNESVSFMADALTEAWRSADLSDYKEFAVNFCFLLKILNPLVQELDLSNYVSAKKSIMKHLMDNCPRIKSVGISKDIWEDFAILPRHKPEDLLPMMALKWPYLANLKLHGFLVTDAYIEAISKHLANLSFVDMEVSLYTFSMEAVQHLSKMSKLKHLRLNLKHIDVQKEDHILVIVHAAGSISSLEKLSFCQSSVFYCGAFVDFYGKLYPKKKLIIEELWFDRDLQYRWPACLSVDKLQVDSYDTLEFHPINLIKGNKSLVKKLLICDMFHAEVYRLVEKFGPGLTDLIVQIRKKHDPRPLDVFRVVAACPKIQRMDLLSSAGYTKTSNFKVHADHFKDCQVFRVNAVKNLIPAKSTDDSFLNISHTTRTEAGRANVSDLTISWLLGCKKFLHKFEVASMEELVAILKGVELEKATCLEQLEEVNFSLPPRDLTQSQVSKILQLVLWLIECSPYLKRVVFRKCCPHVFCGHGRFEQNFPAWFLDILQSLKISLSEEYSKKDFDVLSYCSKYFM